MKKDKTNIVFILLDLWKLLVGPLFKYGSLVLCFCIFISFWMWFFSKMFAALTCHA